MDEAKLVQHQFCMDRYVCKNLLTHQSHTDIPIHQRKMDAALVSNIYDKIKDLKTKYPVSKNSKKIR
ncbi:MAG: hypothetical protein KAI44_09755, partial [Methylococcales bacterium]|nr:hypothetical protein [Methylococcales bacterium]